MHKYNNIASQPPTKYYRISDLVSILGIAQSTLYQMQREGRFIKPALQPSRRLSLYAASDLEQWIASQQAANQ